MKREMIAQDKDNAKCQDDAYFSSSQLTVEQWLSEGVTHYRNRHYKEALSACEKATQLDPNNALGYYGMGLGLHDLGLYMEALSAFEQAIQLHSNNAKAYVGKGNTYYKLKHYAEALVAYDQALQISPNNESVYLYKG